MSALNLKDAIIEALGSMGGCGTIGDVNKWIVLKYGLKWKSVDTTMADLCPESKTSLYHMNDRVLKRVGRGKYCLADQTANLFERKETPMSREFRKDSDNLLTFSFKNAKEILERKNQLPMILEAASLTDLSSKDDHKDTIDFFEKHSWQTELSKFPIAEYRLDAFKDGTAVEIERSFIDAIHRSLFRCIWAYSNGQIDVLVFILRTYKAPTFEKVKRDLEAFHEQIKFPVFLVGVPKTK